MTNRVYSVFVPLILAFSVSAILISAQQAALDAAQRQQVIQAVIANLKQHYAYPDRAQTATDALLAHERSGDYRRAADSAALAGLLTRDLRAASQDNHLEVVYIPAVRRQPLPSSGSPPPPAGQSASQAACTFESVRMLQSNIGYFKLNSFPDVSACQVAAKAALAALNGADALIFDLRDNRGGFPDMVMLIVSYLFDHPVYMYNPREETTHQSWTRSPVPGSRLSDKPVVILTSSTTYSGAEHFSYNMKMLKRATLVGERTAGATDVASFYRINEDFGMGIPTTKPINPYSEPDWAAVGVEPDIKVKSTDALASAEKLLQKKLRAK